MPTSKLQEEEDQHVQALLKEANAGPTKAVDSDDDETEDMFKLMNQIKNARESN